MRFRGQSAMSPSDHFSKRNTIPQRSDVYKSMRQIICIYNDIHIGVTSLPEERIDCVKILFIKIYFLQLLKNIGTLTFSEHY